MGDSERPSFRGFETRTTEHHLYVVRLSQRGHACQSVNAYRPLGCAVTAESFTASVGFAVFAFTHLLRHSANQIRDIDIERRGGHDAFRFRARGLRLVACACSNSCAVNRSSKTLHEKWTSSPYTWLTSASSAAARHILSAVSGGGGGRRDISDHLACRRGVIDVHPLTRSAAQVDLPAARALF